MRIAESILAIILLILQASCGSTQEQPATIEEIAESHVVVLRYRLHEGKLKSISRGTGTVIYTNKRSYIITAKHAAKDISNPQKTDVLEVLSVIGTRYKAKVEQEARYGLDAVVISTKEIKERTKATIRASRLQRDESFIILGSPGPEYTRVSTGKIKHFCGSGFHCRWCPRRRSCVVLDAQIVPGFSGGGMYDRQGRYSGTCVARQSYEVKGPGDAVCITHTSLRELLNKFTRPLR